MLVTGEQQESIARQIEAIETKTDAELICVLAARSDDYYYIPALWAALLALVSPLFITFTPWWHETITVLFIQFVVFVSALLAFRWPPLLIRLIPKNVRYWHAGNLARRQFLENNLHHTQGSTGVLMFVSEAERYVEIIADSGIQGFVGDAKWQSIVDGIIEKIRAGRTFEGLQQGIEQCGTLLIQHIPATTDKNELPNGLVVLDG